MMRSPATTAVKIGRTDRAPHFRARDLGRSGNYATLGPWEIVDYREVEDMDAVEATLHRHFAAHRHSHGSTRELFDVPPGEAQDRLRSASEGVLRRGDLIGRLRLEADLVGYLHDLFRATGLWNFLHLQEAWTLSLFPSTGGGRYFTVNIDRHEVAFVTEPRAGETRRFMLFVDPKVLRGWKVNRWLAARRGYVSRLPLYASASPGGGRLSWSGTLADARAIFSLPFVRRAALAYWTDHLLSLQDRGKRSFFARFHNHNSVQELLRLSPN